MIVRELIAKMGLKVNEGSFKKADNRVEKLKTLMSTIGSYVTVGVVAIGFHKVIKFASDVNETLNVLNASFGKNTQSVLDWAQAFGRASGRSEYQMRELAGTLGAVLNPMMDYNADAASQMSTRLAELAVDLGSFYNTTDDEALNALRSGIVGETEPLKRFGIVMLEANLKAFALEQGITKNIKAMSNAEKTQLRFNYLLSVTKLAHGDAAKTSKGFANASKGLIGGLRDMVTVIGTKVLPIVEYFINGLKKVAIGLADIFKESKIVEAILIILGGVAVGAAGKMLLAWGSSLLPIIAVGVAIGLAALAIDEFLTFLDGGDSVIGEFIDSIYGPGSAAEAADFLKESWASLQDMLATQAIPTFLSLIDYIKTDWNIAFLKAGQGILTYVTTIENAFNKIAKIIKNFTGFDIKEFFGVYDIDKAIEKRQAEIDALAIGVRTQNKGYREREESRQAVKQLGARRKTDRERKKEAIEEKKKEEKARKDRGEYTPAELLAMKQEEKRKAEEEKTKIAKRTAEEKAKTQAKKQEEIRIKREQKEAEAYAKGRGFTVVQGGRSTVVNQTYNIEAKSTNERDLVNKIVDKVKQGTRDINKRTKRAAHAVTD